MFVFVQDQGSFYISTYNHSFQISRQLITALLIRIFYCHVTLGNVLSIFCNKK